MLDPEIVSVRPVNCLYNGRQQAVGAQQSDSARSRNVCAKNGITDTNTSSRLYSATASTHGFVLPLTVQKVSVRLHPVDVYCKTNACSAFCNRRETQTDAHLRCSNNISVRRVQKILLHIRPYLTLISEY